MADSFRRYSSFAHTHLHRTKSVSKPCASHYILSTLKMPLVVKLQYLAVAHVPALLKGQKKHSKCLLVLS